MNKLVKNLFFKSEPVAAYSNPIFNAVYESIYQSIRKENAHRLQPPGNAPKEFYRFSTDMSHDLQGQITNVVGKLIQNANDAANGGIFFNDLPGTVPFTIKNGEVVYIASWNIEALKLKARLSCEYNITALRNSLNFVYQQNPITATEKWVWQCHKSLILSHLSYADQIIGIADFLNGLIRHQQSCGKRMDGFHSIRDDLQCLTIHQLEVWIRENTEGLKNAIQPDAIVQVYAGICDIRNNMICKGDLRPAKHYVKAKHKGSDGQKVTTKEICEALGISRPTVSRLLKDPDNAWGLTPMHISSWKAFQVYLDTHQELIRMHKSKPKSKIRNHKPEVSLAASGDISDCTQSATENFKPYGRKTGKPIKYVTHE